MAWECILDLKDIDFEFDKQYSGKSGTLDNPTQEEQAALNRYGMDGENSWDLIQARYTEYVLRPEMSFMYWAMRGTTGF